MGGLVMPIGFATVPDTGTPVLGAFFTAGLCPDSEQGYQRVGRALDVVVDDHRLELVLRRELDARDVHASPYAVVVFGAATHQPPGELVETRRREEDQVRL